MMMRMAKSRSQRQPPLIRKKKRRRVRLIPRARRMQARRVRKARMLHLSLRRLSKRMMLTPL
jgi:hypothetical protein